MTEFLDSEDAGDPSRMVSRREVPLSNDNIRAFMRRWCPMNQVTVAFRKTDVGEAGGCLDWRCEEDYFFWARLMLASKVLANLPEDLVLVRVGVGMYTRRGGMRYFANERRFQRRMLEKGLMKRIRYAANVAESLVAEVLMPTSVRGWA